MLAALRTSGTLNNSSGYFKVPARGTASQVFQVDGSSTGDPVAVGVSGPLSGLLVTGNVDVPGQVTVRAYNPGCSDVTLPAYTSAVIYVFQGAYAGA